MKNLFILIAILFLSFKSNTGSVLNSESERSILYKGTLNGTSKISLYLKEETHPCGGNKTVINAMYKYDDQDKWILLSVTTDKKKEKYCLVEDGFTGVMFLEENEDVFIGNWISPDTKKQFKIVLKSIALDAFEIEKLDGTLFDDLIFSKNDC